MVIFMLHSLASAVANYFFDKNDKYPIDIYIYGIELVISSVVGTSLIILTGILTHTFIECLIYMVVFSFIRIYTGGYHCMTYLKCNIVTIISYILVFLSLRFFGSIFANPFIMFGGFALTILLAIFFAPVKHENKELTISEKKKYKTLSVVMITLFYSVSTILYYVFYVTQTLIIFPTCITIDIAMLISVIKNIYISRRISQ